MQGKRRQNGRPIGRLKVSNAGYAGRLEVIEGPTSRRRRTDAENARIVAESLMPGVQLAEVVRKYGRRAGRVYDWRKRLRNGSLALPESMAAAPGFAALLVEEPPHLPRHAHTGTEILTDNVVIRVGGMPTRSICRG